MERIASFHTYCKPVSSGKRGRVLCSPTGKTPLQESKRLNIQDASFKRTVWSDEEKVFLNTYVLESPGVPKIGANDFWDDCAKKMTEKCGTPRTGKMCLNRFSKVKSLFNDDAVSGRCRDIGTQTVPQTETVETQTFPCLPVVDKQPVSSFWNNINISHATEGKSEAEVEIYKALGKRFVMEELTDSDRAQLLHAVLFTDAHTISDTVLHISAMKLAVQNGLLLTIENQAIQKCVRSPHSYLFPKDYDSLREFDFEQLVKELSTSQPFLFDCLLAIAVPTAGVVTNKCMEELIPRLGMTYSILLSYRFHELSRLQRVISVVLMDEHVHEKVFDRLNTVGVTMSYNVASNVIDEIGNKYYTNIIDGVKNDKTFRIVGDNVNFAVGVKHERKGHHGNMCNWFASAVILQTKSFDELSDQQQCQAKDLPNNAFLPTPEDENRLKSDFSVLISRVAKEFLPQLHFLYANQPQHILGVYSNEMTEKNLVIPLEVLQLNEQKYADVVQIMEKYEDNISEIYQEAGKVISQVHIGGDQLTRERFTGGKGLRAGCFTEKDRFDHLYPITFEMWHTAMNFLKLIYKHMYNEQGFDKGSMNAERIRLSRKSVKPDVQNNYDHDKDFFLSFLNGYIIEALCEFFGLETLQHNASQHLPPVNCSAEEREAWQRQTFDTFIDRFVFAKDTDATTITEENITEITVIPIHLQMPDGTTSTIQIPKINKRKTQQAAHDRVKHYGHTVLQLGLLYKQFLDLIEIPDRDRMIVTLKYMMCIFKASNNRSKYALEILRFLCHQQSSYSLRTACQSTYGLFVNTKGKVDSHIPADLQMEHIVRKVKKLIKAAGPKNMEGFVAKKTKALAGMSQIAEQFDNSSGVITRANTHKCKSAHDDEMKIIEDLRAVRPFQTTTGRTYHKFEEITAPMQIDQQHYESWIQQHKFTLTFEAGK